MALLYFSQKFFLCYVCCLTFCVTGAVAGVYSAYEVFLIFFIVMAFQIRLNMLTTEGL
jgi:hypothetical protein